MNLEGKVVIVTGSTQGLGERIAFEAAKNGAAGVVICGRNEEAGHSVAKSIEEQGSQAVYVQADLSLVDDCRRVVATCDEVFGRVHGLVNSAALSSRGTLDSTTPELWDHLFALNVRGPFLLTQGAVRIMKREGISGSIVNILSVNAHCGLNTLCAYSSTKGALSTFTKNVAHAHLRDRIRSNGINLGWTETPNEHRVQREEGRADNWLDVANQQMPFGRLIQPQDVAELACYLLSDASGVMTGSLVDYDQWVPGSYGGAAGDLS